MTFHTRWRDVPKAAWRSANFSPAESAVLAPASCS